VEWRLTVDDRPHWSICCADRFSRVGGVTRVQLASNPSVIAVLIGKEGEGRASDVRARVEWANYSGHGPDAGT
jgi:hypothetical protein